MKVSFWVVIAAWFAGYWIGKSAGRPVFPKEIMGPGSLAIGVTEAS